MIPRIPLFNESRFFKNIFLIWSVLTIGDRTNEKNVQKMGLYILFLASSISTVPSVKSSQNELLKEK